MTIQQDPEREGPGAQSVVTEDAPRFLLRDVVFVILFGFGAGLAGSVVIGMVLGIAGVQGDEILDSVAFIFLFQFMIYLGGAFAVQLLIVERRGISWADIGLRPPQGRFILKTIGVWVVVMMSAGVVALLMEALINDTPNVGDQLAVSEDIDLSPLDVIMMVLGVVAAPAVVEELVFRGLLFSSLRRRWSFVPTAIVSALVFAAFHQPWVVIPTIAILGFALAWLRERFDSLYPPILLHALNNGLAILFFFALA